MAEAFQTKDFSINSLRGGQNDTDPPHIIGDDQTTISLNVEYYFSTLGERRRGMEIVDITGSSLDTFNTIVFLSIYLPAGAEVEDNQLFAVSATDGSGTQVAIRASGAWTPITPDDALVNTFPEVLRIQAKTLHGKLFICYKSAVDRMHVWDGTSLRPAGLKQTAGAPTASDTGSGSLTGTRIYRIRWITEDTDGNILLRSEPTDEVTITPSGSGSGVVITQPSPRPNEGETNWEIEASDGDGNFYVIATLPIATTTYTDTLADPTVDFQTFTLSEDIGEYEVMESAKYVIVDQDRVIIGGAWEDNTHGSRISWTPVSNATGVGNDERIPADTTNFIDLDWQDGGPLTGLSDPLNGAFYAFKHARIYKVQRTGNLKQAYESFLLSASRGAIPGSIISGVDEYGRGCVYFLDPSLGPGRISASGLQFMHDINTTWRRVNTTAANTVAHGVFYPDKNQVHWWVSLDSEDNPNYKIISQTTEIRSDPNGTVRGWTTADGTIATAWCSCIVAEKVELSDTGGVFLSYRPYAGFASPHFIQRCDVASTDDGDTYKAKIVTKPYMLVGLLDQWGAMTGALMAKANDDATVRINVSFVRDFGKETNTITTNFVPELSEPIVNQKFDDLRMSESYAIQIQIEDADPE